MNWGDERYVRLYTRDTLTWKQWRWETRAVFALLLRHLDRAGVLDTGTTAKAKAIAVTVDVPVQVAEVALEELLACGTMKESESALVVPCFMAAQETAQSDKLRQSESRARRLAKATAGSKEGGNPIGSSQSAEAGREPSRPVTEGHSPSRHVTLAVLSRAEPAEPEETAGPPSALPPMSECTEELFTPPMVGESIPKVRADPRLGPLTDRLLENYRSCRGSAYKHGGAKDTKALKSLLAIATEEEITKRWTQALKATGWTSCSTLAQLAMKWNDLALPTAATKGSIIHGQQPWTEGDDARAGLSGERG